MCVMYFTSNLDLAYISAVLVRDSEKQQSSIKPENIEIVLYFWANIEVVWCLVHVTVILQKLVLLMYLQTWTSVSMEICAYTFLYLCMHAFACVRAVLLRDVLQFGFVQHILILHLIYLVLEQQGAQVFISDLDGCSWCVSKAQAYDQW